MIKALIFDWHGVLDVTKFELLLNLLSQLSGKEKDEVKSLIKSHERSYAQGDIEPQEFWQTVQDRLKLNGNQLSQAKQSILTFQKNETLWDKLPTLKQQFSLNILSDCPIDKVEVIRAKADLSLFTVTHFSAKEHLLKDASEFFLNIINQLNLKPEECLYVDDSEKHIITATKLGFEVCHFSSTHDLENVLAQL